jgi:16S rRNA (cytosine1402-N4)-methyltransferase
MTDTGSVWHHEPVMVERVNTLLGLKPGMILLEGYMGLGGHSKWFLEILKSDGHLYGFEVDPRVADVARERLSDYEGRFTIFNANCRHFDEYLRNAEVENINAGFFDLGIGYYHLGDQYGMAFKKDLPLDFRLSPALEIPNGSEIIESAIEPELKRLIADAGETRFAGKIARAIVRNRPIRTTRKLAGTIEDAVPRKFHKPGVSPAQRIFSHLRLVVNDEMEALAELMSKLAFWLTPGGRAVFLCYTSDELSRVRRHLKGTGCTCPPGFPKCVCGNDYSYRILADGERPSEEEIEGNPSARSARLIAGELLHGPGQGPAG